ncbi:transient receptor potential cation channel subfamily M member 3-like [Mizuhopecten yessoensis]|uniref:transient receptor potential cation channel subfamily M member 3-like n=1 Tax=Mizuhopecten yessoensis TaxID=6573 RepID=UPI000B45C7E4|nr:transient receptor potential cation channel subfamily M member 3-like [Mizuhopecten yessoensis]
MLISFRSVGEIKTDDIEELKADVLTCIKKRRLIKIFDMTDTSNMPNDMSEVILMALKDVKKESKLSQLKLALYWNKIDTARDIMRNISRENLKTVFDDEGIITSALMLDRFAFMDIFLLKGKDMTSYLTEERLKQLYLQIPSDGVLGTIFWKTCKKNNLGESVSMRKWERLQL